MLVQVQQVTRASSTTGREACGDSDLILADAIATILITLVAIGGVSALLYTARLLHSPALVPVIKLSTGPCDESIAPRHSVAACIGACRTTPPGLAVAVPPKVRQPLLLVLRARQRCSGRTA